MSLFEHYANPLDDESDEPDILDKVHGILQIEKTHETKADVFENEQEFVIQIELPGVEPQSIQIKAACNILQVSALVKCPERSPNKYHLKERFCGQFQRTFSLNGIECAMGIVPGQVMYSQTYMNGILEIKVAKKVKQ